jgi:hypothetical protein
MLWSGCVPPTPDAAPPPLPGPPPVTPRKTWRATGDLRDPAKALDGDLSTAAVSGSSYANAHIDVDLGKACMFNRIIVEHGPDEFGFPHRMAVLTSLDGRYFTPLTQVPGKRRVTNVSLIGPVLARYVRLQAISPGARPWSVAEIYLQ